MRKSKLQQLRLYVYPIYTILCIYLLLSYKTKKALIESAFVLIMVQEKRFELSRDCSHCRLKTACLPFHHSCMFHDAQL